MDGAVVAGYVDTENHGLNRPEEGAKDWDVPLNENFAILDQAVEVRATEQEIKEEKTPFEGAKALATDTKAVYLGDGSTWQYFGTISEVPIYRARPSNPKEGDVVIRPP